MRRFKSVQKHVYRRLLPQNEGPTSSRVGPSRRSIQRSVLDSRRSRSIQRGVLSSAVCWITVRIPKWSLYPARCVGWRDAFQNRALPPVAPAGCWVSSTYWRRAPCFWTVLVSPKQGNAVCQCKQKKSVGSDTPGAASSAADLVSSWMPNRFQNWGQNPKKSILKSDAF